MFIFIFSKIFLEISTFLTSTAYIWETHSETLDWPLLLLHEIFAFSGFFARCFLDMFLKDLSSIERWFVNFLIWWRKKFIKEKKFEI